MASFENNRLCIFCCKSINCSYEIKAHYQGQGDNGRGDYFNCNEKPIVSKIINGEDSLGGFMEMLERYSGGVDLAVGLKELNCCENCMIIINRCGELYQQLKDLEKQIEWKVGSVLEIMKMGSGRMEGEGTSTYFGGIRKEIIDNCFKMLRMGGLEKMEPAHKPESPLPPPPPPIISPLPRKRENCMPNDKDANTPAPAFKRSRMTTKPENNDKEDEDKPKINSSAKAIPLDNNNNSNTKLSSTVAMDTLEPPEGGGQGQVTFTLSKLHINKDPYSAAASFFFQDPGGVGGPCNKIMNCCEGARASANQPN